MFDRPAAPELLAAVEAHLREEVGPKLSGADAFYLKVAANVLAIVRRELEQGPAAEAAEAERLRALTGEDADLEALNRALVEAIESGAIDTGDAALLRHLRATAMDKLAVDNPRYASYLRALDRDGD